MVRPTSLTDRVIYILLSAGFGAVLGALLSFGAMYAFSLTELPTRIIHFSALYFGVVGLFLGATAADLVAATFTGAVDLLASTTSSPGLSNDQTFRPLWVAVLFICWLVGSWLVAVRA